MTSLPNSKSPITINIDVGHTEEVSGGMDEGCQEIATNVQDGATKGGNLPHVMHDGLDFDPRTDHRAPNKVQNKQKQRGTIAAAVGIEQRHQQIDYQVK